jgi:glycosyltransferase involved in cell wall biosynthesis/CDP-glycerol glycerophosphotransferase (TagB/SpsB family)
MTEAKDPALLVAEHELHLARKRIEQQQQTIEALARNLKRTTTPRAVTIGPAAEETTRAPPTPDAMALAPGDGWPSLPLPKTPLPPPPGLGAQSLAGGKTKVVAFAVFGLEGEALEGAVKSVADRQRQAMDFVPVFLTDSRAHDAFRRRGYAFEYLGRNTDSVSLFSEQLFEAMHKWHASAFADLGRTKISQFGVELEQLESFFASKQRFLRSPKSPRQFSVVSAVYNVARYLDDFFRSITRQTLNFKSRIELVMVDDGSTDRSAAVIDRWQRKYPANIRYFRKENGGLSSARNVGIGLASNPWVTFIDPDDFVDRRYFEEIDRSLGRRGEEQIAMVSCRPIFYLEAESKQSDSHPLAYRFKEGQRSVPADSLGRYIQLFVNSAILRLDVIRDNRLQFDSRIRPGFEDAHFVNRYLLLSAGKSVVFLPNAIYLYRKRSDRSSLQDGAERQAAWYLDEIEFGCLGLLHATRTEAGVPRQVQDTVFYSLQWRVLRLVDNQQRVDFLSPDQVDRFRRLLRQAVSMISVSTIMEYDLTELPFLYRVGLLNLFKDIDPPSQRIDVTHLDRSKNLMRLVYWSSHAIPGAVFKLDGVATLPTHATKRERRFVGSTFCWEHIAWLYLGEAQELVVEIDRTVTAIVANGKRVAETKVALAILRSCFAAPAINERGLPLEIRRLRLLARDPSVTSRFRDAWVLLDRDTEADDNAEHFYRHLRTQHPRINAFFVLRADAPDWRRLEAEGFRLLRFNTDEHALALLNAKYLISSHADVYVYDRLPARFFGDLLNFKFVFLQHGVIKDDLSGWLNSKPIACFVTSTKAEFESIADDGPYIFSRKEVVLTGLPRHDALLAPTRDEKFIVIMPTWRHSLVGKQGPAGNGRKRQSGFQQSEYLLRWKSVLRSQRWDAVRAAGFRLIFVPHKNVEIYLDDFNIPPEFSIKRLGGDSSVQDIFRTLSLFITDYSSAAFDIAYVQKPILYYQFDRDFVFGGGHITRRGYFDYERDGFGPVCVTEEGLFDAIDAYVRDGRYDPIFARRAFETFPFRDGRCCERVYDAIDALGRPEAIDHLTDCVQAQTVARVSRRRT